MGRCSLFGEATVYFVIRGLYFLIKDFRLAEPRGDLFDNEFHVELMAPILNLLLQKYKARGGDSWNRILSNQFPVEYMRANVPPECLIYRSKVEVPKYSRLLPEDIFGI